MSVCGKEFIIKGNMINNRNRRDKKQSGYFCSKQCSGRYGREIQLGLRTPTKVDRVVVNKYQVKSALEETPDVEAG